MDAGARGGLGRCRWRALRLHDRRGLRPAAPRPNEDAMSSRRLVVVGNGMAGMRAVEELISRAPDRFEITVIGAEPHPNYNRILLSSVLAGEKTLDDIVLNPQDWYQRHGIRLIAGNRATSIDRAARQVALADVEAMIAAARDHRRAVVIGGGLLGLEAAWGLKRRGMSVALVHLMPTLMERQLDIAAAALLYRDLQARGIAFFTNSQTEEIAGTEVAEAIVLADGRRIPADFVVVAIGVRPNIDLARAAGLDVNRGILVGDDMATSDPDICAIGECIEHNGLVFGLIAPIWEQAK